MEPWHLSVTQVSWAIAGTAAANSTATSRPTRPNRFAFVSLIGIHPPCECVERTAADESSPFVVSRFLMTPPAPC